MWSDAHCYELASDVSEHFFYGCDILAERFIRKQYLLSFIDLVVVTPTLNKISSSHSFISCFLLRMGWWMIACLRYICCCIWLSTRPCLCPCSIHFFSVLSDAFVFVGWYTSQQVYISGHAAPNLLPGG
ncbi:hypothetical protein NPIL_693811 [Nephila pilipes]|uniref:Uncharacterized protein n=1 Tax=Nephila pilipes TaxID=299642 RepID=A0A8X6MN44_NEPPI|nr:hypothetical protein NPIL_693811 [Nephila pilipes]